jgi:CubicO group peptidase (beta-lactamase class C family)
MDKLQHRVQQAADELVESGAELGLQIAVYRNGEPQVDVVAGAADPDSGRAVAPDTLFHVTSTGKGVTAAVVHTLVEDGTLSYDTPVRELWPEFAAHGKSAVTVRHVLTHSAGVPALPVGTTPTELCYWQHMCRVIASAKPWWAPGTRTGYHPQTFGFLLGEVVRRATGHPISRVLAERVAGPLGLGDELFFGVPAAALPRVARLEDPPDGMALTPEVLAGLADQVPFFRVVDGWTAAPAAVLPTAEFCNRIDVLTADIPAGGVMTARALARTYSALMCEVAGTRLISPDLLKQVVSVHVTGPDEITGAPTRRGLGYEIGFAGPLDGPTLFGMAGSGGTAAFADTATGVAVAVAKTRVTAGEFDAFHRVSSIVADVLGRE